MRIAYLTARSYRGVALPPGEVPSLEAKSRDFICAAGAKRGFSFETVYWDESDLPQRGFAAAVIRTCWDYHERPEQFVSALQSHERAGLRIFNSSEVVAWNSRKTYLMELGPAAIPTVWLNAPEPHLVSRAFDELDAAEIVIKPQVGAGSVGTVRLSRNAWSEADLIAGPRGAAMVQPYLRSIETEGERSLFWFGGRFSHAVRKIPKKGDWLANIPGQTRFLSERPPPAALDAAESARIRAPSELLYVRIDLVLGDDERWRVIEIEAIEPYLFLDFAPEAADFFCDALARVLAE